MRAMMDQMVHRGPDGEGIWHRDGLCLGHRRLRILDPSPRGDQPMRSRDGRRVLTFNGEIHNYPALQRELSDQGARFVTETDTEVILAAWERWGTDCFRRFNGMWAMALWDDARHELVLSRDRFGIKPLYWTERDGTLLFASTARALAAAFPELRAPHRGEIARFLEGGVVDGTVETFFERIRALEPATWTRFGADRAVSGRYWGADECLNASRPADEAAELRDLLDDSVRLRLKADCAMGTSLSGGLDSSTVAAIAGRALSSPLPAYAQRYEDPALDESRFASLVLDAEPRLEVRWFEPPEQGLMATIEQIVWHNEAPTPMRGRLPSWHLAREAGREVRVLLDGTGGDELLAGYARFSVPWMLDLARGRARGRSLSAIRSLTHLWGAGAPSRRDLLQPFLLRAAARLPARYRRRSLLRPDFRRLLGAASASRHFHGWLLPATPRPFDSHLKNALWHELTRSGLPEGLHNLDAMTMAHSVEARPPLLDHRLVELCFSLPVERYLGAGWTKAPLRRATAGLLPEGVRWRRGKLGFASPIGRWLRRPEHLERCWQHLQRSELVREAVEPGALRRLRQGLERRAPASQRYRHGTEFLWRLLTLAIWEEQYLGPTLRPPGDGRAR